VRRKSRGANIFLLQQQNQYNAELKSEERKKYMMWFMSIDLNNKLYWFYDIIKKEYNTLFVVMYTIFGY
jgi:hypothetical protein